MSRAITIPKNNKPFIVNINNREYIYRGGETVEVPDEVAEVIEDALELEPKPNKYLSMLAKYANETLTEVTAKDLDGIETLYAFTFYNQKNLTSVEIPHGVTYIGDAVLSYCTNLKSVTLPSSIKSIGSAAFVSCVSLSRVILKAATPPSVQSNTFKELPSTCVIEVPAESVDAYKAAPFWSALASQIKAIEE